MTNVSKPTNTKQQLLNRYASQLGIQLHTDSWTIHELTGIYILTLCDYYNERIGISEFVELTDEILSICTMQSTDHVKVVCVSLYASQIRWAMNNDHKLTIRYLTHIHDTYERRGLLL